MRCIPDPTEDRIVVSDRGDVWSPKMAPASTAPKAGINSERSTETTIPAAIGRIRPKVPNVLPNEKEMKQARTNKRAGSRENARPPPISPARYSPTPSEAMISAVIHARKNTRCQAAIEEGDDDVGVRQDLHRGYRSVGVRDADPQRQDQGDADERRHRQDQVPDLAILSRRQIPVSLTRDEPMGGIDQVPFLDRASFMLAHRAEVEPEICNEEYKQERGDGVVVRRDR